MGKVMRWLVWLINTPEFFGVALAFAIVFLLSSCGVSAYEPPPCDGKTDCQRG